MSESLERALEFDECAVFIQAHVFEWSETQDSPLEALVTGVGSCAATAALATQFLSLRGVHAQFAYARMHGEIHTRSGEAVVGHALAVSAVCARGITRVFESHADARCRVRNEPLQRILMRYHVGPPQEMLDRYHATMAGRPADSLDEVRAEVESRIGARAVLL